MVPIILLILPLLGQVTTASGGWEAVEVYSCDFEAAADIDYDDWPDGWTRRRGPGFPPFAKVAIVPADDAPSGRRVLKLELDGGGVAVSSPPININTKYSFFLETSIRTEQLRHSAAQLSLTLQDADGKTLETHFAPPLPNGPQWHRVTIGPVAPQSDSIRRAVISLQVAPRSGTGDLHGRALLDGVRLSRLPRMTLETNQETNLFSSLQQPEIRCRISGIPQQAPAIRFELLNERDESLATEVTQVASLAAAKRRGDDKDDASFAGQAVWKPTLADYGFYRVRASLHGDDQAVLARESTFVVLRPLSHPESGEFGWSLPAGEKPLSLGALANVLNNAGVHWAKYPIWFRGEDERHADRIAWFAERLSIQGQELIGVLDQPPNEPGESQRETRSVPIASVFIDANLWQPAVDPVLTRLSLKVRHWQLGDDNDASFIGFPDLPKKLLEVKHYLERFGQEVRLGVAWRWLNQLPSLAENPVRFVALGADPPLTATELGPYLEESRKDAPARWILLEPLPRSAYAAQTRARDLVERMLQGRIRGAEGIFVPRPFSTENGLMNDDGTPGELFLPWRTTATLLAGAEHLGTIALPGGSQNHVFARDGSAVLLIWNNRPTTETIYLGDEVKQLDLWGRESAPPTISENGLPVQEIQAGPMPTFVTGVSEQIARWRIGADFANRRLAMAFGKEQRLELKLVNPFPQGVSGEATLHAPATWNFNTRPLRFKLSDRGEQSIVWPIFLQPDANSGPQNVRIDFDIGADRNYRFSINRTLSVGLEDVTVEMGTRLDEQGKLLVDVHLSNQTEGPVSFRCLLFPPERKRETQQLLGVSQGRSSYKFELAHGSELIGKKILFRAEEINGPRVLNYSVIAGQ